MKHYTLGSARPGSEKGKEVHAVIRQYTLCGMALAFAAHPLETDAPLTCTICQQEAANLRPAKAVVSL